jgi:hypothetical protein
MTKMKISGHSSEFLVHPFFSEILDFIGCEMTVLSFRIIILAHLGKIKRKFLATDFSLTHKNKKKDKKSFFLTNERFSRKRAKSKKQIKHIWSQVPAT